VSVVVAKDRRGVTLIVRDTGVGFPPHESARLFDKFYRLDGADRGRTTGTGLGLYLVRRYAERDGARVSGESEGPGRGATFVVTWPAWEAVT
jgi:two-component system sensor histidine kinase MtrB